MKGQCLRLSTVASICDIIMILHLLSSMNSGIAKGVLPLIWIYLYLASNCWRYVSSSWWVLGRTSLASAHVGLPCSNIPGLVRPQRSICLKHPDIMESIRRGAHLAIAGCQEQMKDRRWNCATVDTGANVFGKVTERSSREAAFVYAISSAGVVYSIAKSCHSGDLANCACDPIKHGYFNDTEGEFSWQGCASFINYSSRFAKRFVDSREGAMTDSRALMNLHNNRAGRKAVKKFTKKLCKCHGVSGTCTVRTCWKSLRAFKEIGAFLKRRYDGAVQVTLQQHGNIITDKDFKPFTKFDLVYFEPSPDYCIEDKNVGTLGTAGRQCSKKSKGSGSCDILCCGLGYDTRRVTVVNKCRCKFHYCCNVTCEECQETRDIYTCKTSTTRRTNDTQRG